MKPMLILGQVIVIMTMAAALGNTAVAQDNFQQQLNEIIRKGNPSTKAENLGRQGVALTQACNSGDIRACRKMEKHGHYWCTVKHDCTYLVHLMETECTLGDEKACSTADHMHERALKGYQKGWGDKR